MARLLGAAALPVTLFAVCGGATAQTAPPPSDISFNLIPSPTRTTTAASPRDESFRYAPTAPAPAPVPSDIGLRELPISLKRRTSRFGGAPVAVTAMRQPAHRPATRAYDSRPRTRVTMLRVEDSVQLDERVTATFGWRGVKVSNRNANAAVDDGDDRLSAHDWFLPRATINYRPAADLTLSLGYRESMRAYEGAGQSGAMGLSRPAFDALRNHLHPERSRQWQVDGQWVRDTLRLSLGGYRGTLSDALSFDDYTPINVGSATLSGMNAGIAGELTPGLGWSARYQRAAGRTTLGHSIAEEEIGLGSTWASGPWRGSLQASHAAGSGMPGLLQTSRPAVRLEAGVDYTTMGFIGRPLLLSFRVTDPSRLASMRLANDGGGLRAAELGRAVMFEAKTSW